MTDMIHDDKQYIMNTYARFQVDVARTRGAEWFSEDGTRYIDMGAGIAVNTLGACDPGWADAVCAQARALTHTSNLYYAKPQVELAKALCARSGMARVFFCNSGAEANECVIKAARKYGEATNRNVIVTLKNSFHGRTIATLAATGQDVFHQSFGPFPEGFVYAEPDQLDDLERLMDAYPVCAVLIELVQGEGGVHKLSDAYARGVQALCRARGALFCIDEVQTGNGRAGYPFAYMGFGLSPDLVSTAKGLAGGLPMGAALFGETVKDVLTAGQHGSTFGGNPVCCAAALYVLSQLTDEFLASVRAKGDRVRRALAGARGVISVDGMGLMLGVHTARPVAEVVKDCMAGGVLPLTAKGNLRLMPPLNISDALLDEALAVITEVLNR